MNLRAYDFLQTAIPPADRAAVGVRHIAVELAGVVIKDQRQEETIALPHGQLDQPVDGLPGEHPFGIAGERGTPEAVDPEDEAQLVGFFNDRLSDKPRRTSLFLKS
jgi:hypothetical protein